MSGDPGHALAPQRASLPEPCSHIELYTVFRDYLKHEDDLINQRLNWNFSIQGFLFGAYAFAFQKTAELWNALSHVHENPPLDLSQVRHGLGDLYTFLLVIAVVGMFVSLVSFLSVHAATLALTELERRWLYVNPEYRSDKNKPDTHGPVPPGLPGLVGGGNPTAARSIAFQAARFLPWIFIIAWGYLAVKVWPDFQSFRVH